MKKKWNYISIAVIAILFMSCATLNEIVGKIRSEIDEINANAQTGEVKQPTCDGTRIDSTSLKDLFANSPFDRSIKEQYPRVAITVKESPSFHSEMTFNTVKYEGFYKLKATIWYSKTKSEVIEDFIFCFPDDVVYNIPLSDFSNWALWIYLGDDCTGSDRTEGPGIPKDRIPSDLKHRKYFGSTSIDVGTYDGLMVCSLLYKMGFDWGQSGDGRVWITQFLPALEE